MSTIAERLLLVRGKIKQGEFATLLDVNPNTLRSYENGRSCPNQEFLERVCVQFSVSAEWLLLGRGPMHIGEAQPTNTPQPEQTQPSETTSTTTCARCERLEEELAEERRERRELSAELREVNAENRRLAKENNELIKENAELRKEKPEENLTISELRKRKIEGTLSPLDEQQNIPPSDRPQTRPTICK